MNQNKGAWRLQTATLKKYVWPAELYLLEEGEEHGNTWDGTQERKVDVKYLRSQRDGERPWIMFSWTLKDTRML